LFDIRYYSNFGKSFRTITLMKKLILLILSFLLLFGCTSKKDDYRIEKFIWLSYRYNDPVPLNDYTLIDGVMRPVLHVARYFEITNRDSARLSIGVGRTLQDRIYGSIIINDPLISTIDSALYNNIYEKNYADSASERSINDITAYTIVYKFKGQNEKSINYYSTKHVPPQLLNLHKELMKASKTYIDTPIHEFNYKVDLKKFIKDYEHYKGLNPPEGIVIQKRRKHFH
jgi:hypothetical protein